jgi:hypothetical protein
MPQHFADRFDLVRKLFDAIQSLQTQELIETTEQAEHHAAFRQQ